MKNLTHRNNVAWLLLGRCKGKFIYTNREDAIRPNKQFYSNLLEDQWVFRITYNPMGDSKILGYKSNIKD